jgi:hypothetical protein
LRAPGEAGADRAAAGDAIAQAGALTRYAIGSLHQYAKSGFAKKPTQSFADERRFLFG